MLPYFARYAPILDKPDPSFLGVREVALGLSAVLLLGLGALQQPRVEALAAPAVSSAAVVVPPVVLEVPELTPTPAQLLAERVLPLGPPLPPVPVAPVPAPAPPPPPPPPPAPAKYLPQGTGIWLHEWQKSEGGNAAAVMAQAQNAGASHLFVQTGSTRKGWIGDEVLSQLMPVTIGTGMKVIAWDFPKLDDPEADAQRMARAALWEIPGVPRVAAVAPDVETAAEGAKATPDRITRYYAELRRLLPESIAVLATVPWPSEKRTRFYPYAETAPFTDAWIPMAYWYNRSPVDVTRASMEYFRQFGKPVMPVGQGYDGRIDAPYLAPDPDPRASVQAFFDTAKAGGATSVSLWSWQTLGVQQWAALKAVAPYFPVG